MGLGRTAAAAPDGLSGGVSLAGQDGFVFAVAVVFRLTLHDHGIVKRYVSLHTGTTSACSATASRATAAE